MRRYAETEVLGIREYKMITREELEKREYMILSEYAAKAAQSKGRAYDEE